MSSSKILKKNKVLRSRLRLKALVSSDLLYQKLHVYVRLSVGGISALAKIALQVQLCENNAICISSLLRKIFIHKEKNHNS